MIIRSDPFDFTSAGVDPDVSPFPIVMRKRDSKFKRPIPYIPINPVGISFEPSVDTVSKVFWVLGSIKIFRDRYPLFSIPIARFGVMYPLVFATDTGFKVGIKCTTSTIEVEASGVNFWWSTEVFSDEVESTAEADVGASPEFDFSGIDEIADDCCVALTRRCNNEISAVFFPSYNTDFMLKCSFSKSTNVF